MYGDKVEELGMCDTRSIMHGQRFFMSINTLDPKIYEVTKIKDINPQGIIKLSIKQDEFDIKRDSLELRVCDYYSNEGDIQVDIPDVEIPTVGKTSEISWLTKDENGEFIDSLETELKLGTTYYFSAVFSDDSVDPQWKIELIDDEGVFSDEDKEYFVGLMKMTKLDSSILALKPGKASSLKGKMFNLSVSDSAGEYYSSIEVEVAS